MPKYIGIDYGLSRTGLAVSDPAGKIAFPLATLKMGDFPNRKALLDELARLAVTNRADALVMGMPLFEDGAENGACRVIRNAIKRIARRISLPIYVISENLSSYEAALDLEESGCKKNKRKEILDQQAACRILQSFLNQPQDRRSSI